MGESNTVVSAYILYRHLQQYWSHPSICMSKFSLYFSLSEADFAFTRRKEIIPLKMQRGYNPDGWLGVLIGARLFVEFSPQKPFDKQIAATMQQLVS